MPSSHKLINLVRLFAKYISVRRLTSQRSEKKKNLERQWRSCRGRRLGPGPVGTATATAAAAVFRDLPLSKWLPPLCGAAVWQEPGRTPATCCTLCWLVLFSSLGAELLGADEPRDAYKAKEECWRLNLAESGLQYDSCSVMDGLLGKILLLCWDVLAGLLPPPPLSEAVEVEQEGEGA